MNFKLPTNSKKYIFNFLEMDIEYTWIYCRQFRLLTWTHLLASSKGGKDGTNGVDGGNRFYIVRLVVYSFLEKIVPRNILP